MATQALTALSESPATFVPILSSVPSGPGFCPPLPTPPLHTHTLPSSLMGQIQRTGIYGCLEQTT